MITQITIHFKDKIFFDFMTTMNHYADEFDIERFEFWLDYFVKHESHYRMPTTYTYEKIKDGYLIYSNNKLLYTIKRTS